MTSENISSLLRPVEEYAIFSSITEGSLVLYEGYHCCLEKNYPLTVCKDVLGLYVRCSDSGERHYLESHLYEGIYYAGFLLLERVDHDRIGIQRTNSF